MAGKPTPMMHKRFGRWLVLKDSEVFYSVKGVRTRKCLCQCDCGTIKYVSVNTLLQHRSKSCGCLQLELAKNVFGKSRKKQNPYIIVKDFVIMYTFKNEPIFVDIADLGRLLKYCWRFNDSGYVVTTTPERKTLYMHRYIMNASINIDVDHKHGSKTKFDNRKANLRCATVSQNGTNKIIQSNNTSGVPGVSYNKRSGKWRARVWRDKHEILLGSFETFEEAVAVRRKAEDTYYGEFSYQNSRYPAEDEEDERGVTL